MNSNMIVLDTHVLLWSLLKPEELSEKVRGVISSAQKESKLIVCSISLWEISMLKFKKRINIYQPVKNFLAAITNVPGLIVKDISSEIASEGVLLTDEFQGDPADRIIVATTKVYGATLITRDQRILSWAEQGDIRFLRA
ncbi:type II toxin-antitoxin system VapC family toxin [Candidatus Phycorickettsia trachydisci]|nr:type II toxin-antitoxin system VapC family toxin [Candidatus Phycorickettsia trachydisci]